MRTQWEEDGKIATTKSRTLWNICGFVILCKFLDSKYSRNFLDYFRTFRASNTIRDMEIKQLLCVILIHGGALDCSLDDSGTYKRFICI